MYKCKYCLYETTVNSNYHKHIKTRRHKENKIKYEINRADENNTIYKINLCPIICTECGVQFKYPKNLFAHQKKCLSTKFVRLKNELNHKNTELTTLEQEKDKYFLQQKRFKEDLEHEKQRHQMNEKNKDAIIYQIERKFLQEIEMLKQLNEKLKVENENIIKDHEHVIVKEQLKSANDKIDILSTENNFSKDAFKKANKLADKSLSNMQYVIQNYDSAPNFLYPSTSFTRNEYVMFLRYGAVEGPVAIFKQLYANDIPAKQRSLWCFDTSRNKFALRDGDSWVLDIGGRKIMEKCIGKIIRDLESFVINDLKDKLNRGGHVHTSEIREHYRRQTTLVKMSDKGTQDKIMRKAGGLFTLERNI
jgi:hypothetical protein